MRRLGTVLAALITGTASIALAAGGAQAGGAELRIDAAAYVPAAWDLAIPEQPRNNPKNWSFGNPDTGGLLTLVVANDGTEAADVTGVTVDGQPLDAFLAATCQDPGLACTASPAREMAWARWLPAATIPAGGAATLQLKRTTTPGPATTIGIDAGGSHVEATVPLQASPVHLGLAYRDGSDAVMVVRNDAATAASITGVHVDGHAVAYASLGGQAAIPAGRTAILRVANAAPAEGTTAALTVTTSVGDASAGVRLFTPFFPIGDWFGDGWNDPAFLADAKAHHIDTSWGYDWTVPLAEQYGFKLIADAVPCLPGQTSGCIAQADESVVAAYAYGDEVEFGHSAQEVLANVDRRRLNSSRPTFVNDASQRIFQTFAAQADVGAMDHYTSAIGLCTITADQPSSMQGQPVQWAGNYTRYLKLNTEPNPAWTWSQAGNNGNPARSCWHGLPTVDEMRAQLFSELANGSKGVMWFIFGGAADVSAAPALWAEAGGLGATLDATRGWLSSGDLDPGALVKRASDTEVGVISAPGAMVVPVLDLRYRMKPKGYVWSTRTNVGVTVRVPAWLAGGGLQVGQVQDGVFAPVPFTRNGSQIAVTIPSMKVGTVLVIRPS